MSHCRRDSSYKDALLDIFCESSAADEKKLQNAVHNVRSALNQLQSINLASYDAIQSRNTRLMEGMARAAEMLETQKATCDRLRAQRDDLRAACSNTQNTLSEAQKTTTGLQASMRVMKETLTRERTSHLATRQKLSFATTERDNLLRESELAATETHQLQQQLAATEKKLEQEHVQSLANLRKLREALRREDKASASSQQQCPPRYETRQAKRNREKNADQGKASTDGDVDSERAEEARQAALRESMEKLRKIQEQEDRDRMKRKRTQDDEEVRERQERAKRQRLAEEQREMLRRRAEEEHRRQQEEDQRRRQEQADEQQKMKAWREATKREEIRCQKRDIHRWAWPKLTSSAPPSSYICLERFIYVLEEFASTPFSETQPVTISSVPWPVLLTPRHITFDVLDETKIRAFFAYAKTVYSPADYKKLLSKARVLFHPDKWRSRNLLKTIMKEGIRETMDRTVTIVSQTLNALFVET